jgi:hypothetical protein
MGLIGAVARAGSQDEFAAAPGYKAVNPVFPDHGRMVGWLCPGGVEAVLYMVIGALAIHIGG